MADLDEVAALLHIHEKASAHGDLLKGIADGALAKLRQINAEHLAAQTAPAAEPEVEAEEPEGSSTPTVIERKL